MPKIEKNFVTSEFKTTLVCPKCKKSKKTDVSSFMLRDTEIRLKCKCKCEQQFKVTLERRRSARKDVLFPGWLKHKEKKYQIRIKNISKHGMKIFLWEKTPLTLEERIGIEFNTDYNPLTSLVNKDVKVKKMISPTEVVCEFLSFDHIGNLGKYFAYN